MAAMAKPARAMRNELCRNLAAGRTCSFGRDCLYIHDGALWVDDALACVAWEEAITKALWASQSGSMPMDKIGNLQTKPSGVYSKTAAFVKARPTLFVVRSDLGPGAELVTLAASGGCGLEIRTL
jgi:hypothetical protein